MTSACDCLERGVACPFLTVASFANLHRALRTTAKGKRFRRSAAEFLLRGEHELLRLAEELAQDRWRPGGYRVFEVVDPKRRRICAAPFRDRVVHQALVQCIEGPFERGFVYDSYSCRIGKGTHAALQRVRGWARRYPWALKLDVEKFFPSVDHAVALQLVARRVRCGRILALLAGILASWTSDEAPLHWYPGDDLFTPGDRPRGLPIGNLTSQFLANVVLDPVDHRLKDGLGVRAYARYCDDIVVFGCDPRELQQVRAEIVAALARVRLWPNRRKTRVLPTAQGVPWVGFVVKPDRVEFSPQGVARVRRRLRAFGARGGWQNPEVRSSLAAWDGHARWGLRPVLLSRMRELLQEGGIRSSARAGGR
ncbi:MAG: group II intron reverse transcriptase domain-containing protein [Planctomycetes bacterium]|nr:group II intron reverse transcriptase domain-containing protein [Planctomycetota bacterium]